MAFDDCTSYPASLNQVKKSMDQHISGRKGVKLFDKNSKGMLFGIVQGHAKNCEKSLRL